MKSFSFFKKSLAIFACLISLSIFSFAIPSWTRTNYTSSTAFIGIVKINYYDASFPITIEAGDYIGAFVGEECRMIAEVFSYNGGLYVSSVIQGGDASDMTGSTSDSEEVEWKVWDNSANKLISNQVYGTLWTESAGEIFDFEIGKPNTNSELQSLAITDYTLDPTFSATTTDYEISVPYGTTLPTESAYTAVVKDSRATSTITAATTFDANNKAVTTITVTAEDGTTTKYTVTFIQEACTATAPIASEIPNVKACFGETIDKLVATFSNNSYSAVWYNVATDGTALFSGNTYNHGKTAAGTYTYYVAKNDGTCESTDRLEVTVTINEKPTVTLSGLETSYCSDDTDVTLAASQKSATFTVDGKTATKFSPTSGAGTYEVACSYTDANGCSATDSKTVTVNQIPVIDLSAVSTKACADEVVTLTPTKGTWTGTGVTGTSFSSATAGSFELTYSEKSSEGCSASDATTIVVSKATAPTATPATVEKNGTVPSLQASATGTINWYESETGSSIATGTSYKPTVSTASETVFTYYVSNTENGCESEKVAVTLTVTSCTTEAPEIAAVEAICDGDVFPTLTATGTNITWYDAITDGNKLAEGTYTPIAAGTYYASQNPGCEGPRASVKVDVKEKPAKPTLTAAGSCEGESLNALTSDVTADWYASKTGAALETSTKTYTPSSITTTTTFYANQTVNGCTSDFAEVTYTLTEKPSAPQVDATSACLGNTADYIVRMNGNLVSGATLQWYDENDAELGTEKIQTVTVTTAKDYTYTAKQTINGCTSEAASAVLTVHALPTPKITVESSYCSDDNNSYTLTADIPDGDFTIDDVINDSFTPSALSLGSHTAAYSVANEFGCYGETKAVFAVADCAAPAVTNIEVSPTTIFLEKGTTKQCTVVIEPDDAPQTVSWKSSNEAVATVDENGLITYVGVGTATITVTSTYTPTQSASVTVEAGIHFTDINLTLTQATVGETINLEDYLVIEPADATFQENPTFEVQNITDGTTVTTSSSWIVDASLVGKTIQVSVTVKAYNGESKTMFFPITIIEACDLTAPTVAESTRSKCYGSTDKVTFTATGDADADWIWTDASNTTVATTNSFETVTAGTYYVYQKKTDCESPKTTVKLTELAQVTAPIVDNITACKGETATFTSDNAATIWYASDNTELATGKTYTPSTIGTYYAKVKENECLSDATTITFTETSSPDAPVVADVAVCEGETATFTSNSASTVWYSSDDTKLSTGKTYSPTTAGTYYAKVELGTCESEKTTITYSIKTKPTTPVVADVAVCEGETATFTSNNASTIWYSSANKELTTGKTYSPTTVGTYYAKVEENGCLSDAVKVSYSVNATPTLTANDKSAVVGATVPNLSVTTASTNTVTWYYNNEAVGTGTSFATGQTEVGIYTYNAIATSAEGCKSESVSVTLQINDCNLAAPTVAKESQSVCEGQTNPSFTVSSGNTITWYADAELTQKLATSKLFKPTDTDADTYYYYVTQKTTCESPSTKVTLTINALPSVSIDAVETLTTLDDAITFTVSPVGGTLSGTGVTNEEFDPSVGVGTYTITYKYTDENGCSNSATTKVTVKQGIDRTQLGDTIARAVSISTQYASDDLYPISAKDALTQAIATAQTYYDNHTSYTQSVINQQVTVLSKAIQDFLNSKIEVVDISPLEAKIAEAVATIQANESRKGTDIGNIPESSFTILQNAIATARTVVANPPTTQAGVTTAVATLQAAIDAFLNSEISNHVEKISFETSKLYLIVGEEYTPEVLVTPSGATTDVIWTSSNTDVVNVSGSGKITAKATGSVAVTATSVINSSASARLVVIVTEKPVLQSVSMNKLGNQLYLDFSEDMADPESTIYTDLYVYGTTIPMYNITNVSTWPLDSKRIVVTITPYVDNLDDITIMYKGSSLSSIYGGTVEPFTYLPSTAVDEIAENNVILYPTLTTDFITIDGLSIGNSITVVSTIGKTIMTSQANSETEQIDVNQLIAGTYYVFVSDGQKRIAQLSFIKK